MVLLQESVDKDYQQLAAAINDERQDRIVYSVDAVQPGDTVLYIDPPSELSESTLYDLYSMDARGTIDGVGVITGRTPAEARRLYDRSLTNRADHGILVRGRNQSASCHDGNVSVLSGDEVTIDNIEAMCSGGLESLSMRVKARDIHAFADDGLICGIPSSTDEFSFDGKQPSCVTDGKKDCLFPGKLLHADRIDAQHVFLSGCSSPLANNSTGLPVNLGLGLLSNAVSLVAPIRPISVHQYHVALNYALVRAGYPATERVRILNKAAANAGMGVCQYVLFGRPDRVPETTIDGSYGTETTAQNDGYAISLTEVDTHIIDISVPATPPVDDQDQFFVRTKSGEQLDDPIYYVAFREGDDVRVVGCSWGRIETDSLDLELCSSRVLENSRLIPALHQAAARVDVGLIGGKTKRQFTDAKQRLAGAAKYHRREAFDADAANSTQDRLEEVQASVDRARESLAEVIAGRSGGLLQTQYADSMYTSDLAIIKNGCPYCNRDVHVQTATDMFHQVERSLGVCPFHIYIFDIPSEAVDFHCERDQPSFPTFNWEFERLRYGDVGDLTISFASPQADASEATVALRAISSGGDQRVFSPLKRTVKIDVERPVSATFELDSSELDPEDTTGGHWFEATVVTDDLQVYVGMRTLYIWQ